MADRDDDEIIYETIREGSSQYWHDDEGIEDPYRYLNAEGNEEVNEEVNVEGNKEEAFGSQSQPSSVEKRARGQRGPARKIEGRHVITGVGQDDRPIAPADAARNYVHHSGWVVRDNIPINIVNWHRRREHGDDELPFLPDAQKDMLWKTMLETFMILEEHQAKVREWTLKRMAEQFQDFKGDLYKKYILKGLTPNFDNFPKLTDHWNEFVAYKTGVVGQAKMTKNKANAAKKKYHHHLGSGGYSTAMPKWEEMEAGLMERGIVPATVNWPDRSKNWYYAHGGTLNPVDGSFIFGDVIHEAASRLLDAVEASLEGTFWPDREKDELTLALQNP